MTGSTEHWKRILAPLAGVDADQAVLAAAAEIATAHDAVVAAVFAPTDVIDMVPWVGDGFMGGVAVNALTTLKEITAEAEQRARGAFEALHYDQKTFEVIGAAAWAALSTESRLSDLVVFDDATAKGQGPLAHCFEDILASEQRPTLVARAGLRAHGRVAVAWDGGKEASRAARVALPLLRAAERVIILTASSSEYPVDPRRLVDFFAARGVAAEARTLDGPGDTASQLLAAAKAEDVNILVAGAYGHARLREFIFGGATRAFLNAIDAPSLLLSH